MITLADDIFILGLLQRSNFVTFFQPMNQVFAMHSIGYLNSGECHTLDNVTSHDETTIFLMCHIFRRIMFVKRQEYDNIKVTCLRGAVLACRMCQCLDRVSSFYRNQHTPADDIKHPEGRLCVEDMDSHTVVKEETFHKHPEDVSHDRVIQCGHQQLTQPVLKHSVYGDT